MAERELLLGLDAGNTVIKAVLFDRSGRQLASSQRNGDSHTRRRGMSSATWVSSGRMPRS
jgi:sugar (pentulose or hexulose) kinase